MPDEQRDISETEVSVTFFLQYINGFERLLHVFHHILWTFFLRRNMTGPRWEQQTVWICALIDFSLSWSIDSSWPEEKKARFELKIKGDHNILKLIFDNFIWECLGKLTRVGIRWGVEQASKPSKFCNSSSIDFWHFWLVTAVLWKSIVNCQLSIVNRQSSIVNRYIFTYLHLCIFTFLHLYIFTSLYLYIFISLHLYIFTSLHLYIFTSLHLYTYAIEHLDKSSKGMARGRIEWICYDICLVSIRTWFKCV
jgi:hypothetical protein